MDGQEMALSDLLEDFWLWAGYSAEQYAVYDTPDDHEICNYPRFVALRQICFRYVNTEVSEKELSAFLVCLALDNEDEEILDYCKENADSDFIARLARMGCCHPQPHARWQIAELLRCREIEGRDRILQLLSADPHFYVQSRARSSISFLVNK